MKRRAISQASAIIIIVAIMVAAFGGYLAGSIGTQTPTATSTSPIQSSTVTTTASVFVPTTITRTTTQYIPPSNFPSSANSTNSTLGLTLGISMNTTLIASGQAFTVNASVWNALNQANNVSAESVWAKPLQNLDFSQDAFGCHQELKLAVFQGYYGENNVSSAANALSLNWPSGGPSCVGVNINSFSWYDQSKIANVSVGSYSLLHNFQVNATVPINGNYSGNSASNRSSTPTPFPQDIYTIVVGDEWGQLVTLHFMVYISSSTITRAANTSTACSITGQPGGIEISIISDSTSTPVVGARVYATNQPALCNDAPATSKSTIAFTTSNAQWYSLPSDNNAAYSFIVSYSGQNYTLNANLRPVSMTCATLFIPSGHTNVTITEYASKC